MTTSRPAPRQPAMEGKTRLSLCTWNTLIGSPRRASWARRTRRRSRAPQMVAHGPVSREALPPHERLRRRHVAPRLYLEDLLTHEQHRDARRGQEKASCDSRSAALSGSRIREVSDSADLRLRHPRGAQDGDGLRGFLGGWLFDATGGYQIAIAVAAPPVLRWVAPSRHVRAASPLSVASGPESGAYAAIPEIRRRSHSDQSHGVRRRTVGVWDQQEAGKLDVNVASLKTCVGGPETTRGEGHR